MMLSQAQELVIQKCFVAEDFANALDEIANIDLLDKYDQVVQFPFSSIVCLFDFL